MALNFKNLNGNRGGGSGGGFSETIAIEFKEVQVKNARGATPEEDVLVGYLLHDTKIKGLQYTTDAEGNPTCEVRVKVKDRKGKVQGKGKSALEIFDLPKRKDSHFPVQPGGVILLENAYFDDKAKVFFDDKPGAVMTTWLHVATRDPQSAFETAHVGLPVSVGPEHMTRGDNPEPRQFRYVAIPFKAKQFQGRDEFAAIVEEFLKEEPDNGGGRPCVSIRAIDRKDPSNSGETMIYMNFVPGENGAEGRMETGEEAVKRFLNDPRNAEWVGNIDVSGSEELDEEDNIPLKDKYFFEAIPMFRFKTGTKSLPSMNDRGRDDSEIFQIRDEQDGQPVKRNDGKGWLMTSGFAVGTLAVGRKEDSPNSPWFGKKTWVQNRFGEFYLRRELLTDNLPANVREYFQKKAQERGKLMLEEITSRRQQAQQPSQDQGAQDDEALGFGDPDPSYGRGGMTPR